jgi:hypothetical protein
MTTGDSSGDLLPGKNRVTYRQGANVIKRLVRYLQFLYEARVFVRLSWKCLPGTNTLTYCKNM